MATVQEYLLSASNYIDEMLSKKMYGMYPVNHSATDTLLVYGMSVKNHKTFAKIFEAITDEDLAGAVNMFYNQNLETMVFLEELLANLPPYINIHYYYDIAGRCATTVDNLRTLSSLTPYMLPGVDYNALYTRAAAIQTAISNAP